MARITALLQRGARLTNTTMLKCSHQCMAEQPRGVCTSLQSGGFKVQPHRGPWDEGRGNGAPQIPERGELAWLLSLGSPLSQKIISHLLEMPKLTDSTWTTFVLSFLKASSLNNLVVWD